MFYYVYYPMRAIRQLAHSRDSKMQLLSVVIVRPCLILILIIKVKVELIVVEE